MSEYVSEILAFIFIAVGVVYFNGKIANVLDEKQFGLIEKLLLIMFGYYFGQNQK